MFRDEPAYAAKAADISAKTKDITEYLAILNLPAAQANMCVAYHSACSLQHGQQIKTLPQQLLRRAGFDVVEPLDSHLCCGSAGTYNIVQPEIAGQLRNNKLASLALLDAQVIAAGNIGCITQLQGGVGIPVLHTVQLLDWAYGGDLPPVLPKPEREHFLVTAAQEMLDLKREQQPAP